MGKKSSNPALALPIPKKDAEFLLRAHGDAIGNTRYVSAIKKHERAAKKYNLSLPQKSRLASLYDHAAERSRDSKMKRDYAHKGEILYRQILRQDPKNAIAWRGLGKLAGMRGDSKEAERFYKHAFSVMKRLPRKMRGALAVGYFFEQRGELKRAEKWYLKEFNLLKDFGSATNLFFFYEKMGQLNLAKRFARITKKLMEKELQKPQYKSFDVKHNSFFINLRKRIVKMQSEESVRTPRKKG